ncbi:hypothetical protein MKQ70_14495 [Chitinophaga sedimenti]|uniref:hypothetical protein n=1 Tax=Chitinophaga sedimenti TaxID=2033606 RepID=UPI002003B769|nr:hypothetical protein [Chitinophaga sedimenti]MCK7556158.1 hypothetical protein [Chitinophaga sedimenti]
MILLISILINIPAVQNMLVKQVTKRLSARLHTRVEIKRVNLRLFNSMRMEGTYIEDQHKDTLLYAGALQVRITDWFFFKETPVLKFVGLEDATINLVRHKGDSTGTTSSSPRHSPARPPPLLKRASPVFPSTSKI